MRSRIAWIGRLAIAVGTAAAGASAQSADPVTLTGRVVADTTRRPIQDVDITILDVKGGTSTSRNGEFRLSKVPRGSHQVRFRKIGYAMIDTALVFGADSVTIVMQQITELDSVQVVGDMRDPGMEDFERHRKMGFGHFYGRADIEKFDNLKIADLLVQTSGIAINRGTGGQAWVQGKGRTSGSGSSAAVNREDATAGAPFGGCYATVYLDNMKVYSQGRSRGGQTQRVNGVTFNDGATPLFDINSIPVNNIEAVEYYAGAAQIPTKYMGLNTTCGVLVIHTRRPDKKKPPL